MGPTEAGDIGLPQVPEPVLESGEAGEEVKESTLIPKILSALRAHGCKCIKTHGNQYSVKGNPDILGCCPGGQMFALEVKIPGGEAPFYDHIETPKQHFELLAWKQAGARVGVVRSVKDAVCVAFGNGSLKIA